jgi:hypothetical protein
MALESPEKRLKGFIDKFDPPMAARIRAARRRMRALLPGAVELVYDNYNFFVIGYGPTARPSQVVASLAAYAKGLTLFFLHGIRLEDPGGLLIGAGRQVRSIRLDENIGLHTEGVRQLLQQAAAQAKVPFDRSAKHRLIIQAVAAKQRPRRAAKAKRAQGGDRGNKPAPTSR